MTTRNGIIQKTMVQSMMVKEKLQAILKTCAMSCYPKWNKKVMDDIPANII